MIGFALPLTSSIAHSDNVVDMVIWGLIALIVQIAAYYLARIPVPDLSQRIANGEIGARDLARLRVGDGRDGQRRLDGNVTMKRSSQVALVLMGVTGTTATAAYMMPARPARSATPAASPAAQLAECRDTCGARCGAVPAAPLVGRLALGFLFLPYDHGSGHSGGIVFAQFGIDLGLDRIIPSQWPQQYRLDLVRLEQRSTARGGFGSTGASARLAVDTPEAEPPHGVC